MDLRDLLKTKTEANDPDEAVNGNNKRLRYDNYDTDTPSGNPYNGGLPGGWPGPTLGSTCVRWGDGVNIREKEGISTLFPVSDLDTKWYSICAAHSERARYVQWIMRLWHDVTGTKSNTQPENWKGFSMQMNCWKCEMFIFSFPWNWMLNSLIEQSVLLSFHRCGSCSPVDLSTLSQLSDSLNKMR